MKIKRVRRFLAIALSSESMRRCLPTALIVGSILSAINQGSVILGGDATEATWLRVFVNYLTPFVVASIGFVSGAVSHEESEAFKDST